MHVRKTEEPADPRETWAAYVEELQRATGLTDRTMGERLGVDPSTVWRWRKGRQKPESLEAVQALADLLQLDIDEVLAAAGLKPGPPPEAPAPPPDPEVELIMSAPVSRRQRERMLRLLGEMRKRDQQRRIEDLRLLLGQEEEH